MRSQGAPRSGETSADIRIVADIGGTNARFATVGEGARDLRQVEVMRCADYAGPAEAVRAYMRGAGIHGVGEVCLAVAGPVDQDLVDLPNNEWVFSRLALRDQLGARLEVINDFTAQAMCIEALGPEDVSWLGSPRPREGGVRAILGPGTGLGVAMLLPGGRVIPSEGGHVAFAPTTRHEMDLLECLVSRFRRVSAERVLSGPGLENLFWANHELRGGRSTPSPVQCSASEISRLAFDGDELALETVGDFFDILASFAGDVALFTWSTGGVFLSGGVLRKLFPLLDVQRFRARFEDKGRFTRVCERMPVAWISHTYPGLLGCAAWLDRASAREEGLADTARAGTA